MVWRWRKQSTNEKLSHGLILALTGFLFLLLRCNLTEFIESIKIAILFILIRIYCRINSSRIYHVRSHAICYQDFICPIQLRSQCVSIYALNELSYRRGVFLAIQLQCIFSLFFIPYVIFSQAITTRLKNNFISVLSEKSLKKNL